MLTPRMLLPIGALVFVAGIAAIAVTEQPAPDLPSLHLVHPAATRPAPSPLDETLARCAELGEAGGRDLTCLKAWSQNRRRFLGAKIQWPDDPTGEDHPIAPKANDTPRNPSGPVTGLSSVPPAPGMNVSPRSEAR